MQPRQGQTPHSLSSKTKNAAMLREEPTIFVLKNEKCGHARSEPALPCPQKRKMQPRQGQNPHSLSAKMKNAAMPKVEPALPVLKNEKCGHAKGRTPIPCPQCWKPLFWPSCYAHCTTNLNRTL